MTFSGVTAKAVDTLFALGGEFVKSITYVRPPGANPLTGQVSGAEVRVVAQALVPSYAPAGFTLPQRLLARVVMKASALTSISLPAVGDFIILPDGTRLDVMQATLDLTAVVWLFDCRETPAEDYGDLTAHGSSADHGDLTAHTSEEDYGPLW
jgi:hypothetical protein